MANSYRAKPRHVAAYCWANGAIGFTTSASPICPKGSLPIIAGPFAKVKRAIYATARIPYDNKGFLVPGIPEAKALKRDPLKALQDYTKWLLKRPDLYEALPVESKQRRAAR